MRRQGASVTAVRQPGGCMVVHTDDSIESLRSEAATDLRVGDAVATWVGGGGYAHPARRVDALSDRDPEEAILTRDLRAGWWRSDYVTGGWTSVLHEDGRYCRRLSFMFRARQSLARDAQCRVRRRQAEQRVD